MHVGMDQVAGQQQSRGVWPSTLCPSCIFLPERLPTGAGPISYGRGGGLPTPPRLEGGGGRFYRGGAFGVGWDGIP